MTEREPGRSLLLTGATGFVGGAVRPALAQASCSWAAPGSPAVTTLRIGEAGLDRLGFLLDAIEIDVIQARLVWRAAQLVGVPRGTLQQRGDDMAKPSAQRYRQLDVRDVELGRLNVLVGPNNAGKTTLLNALVATLTGGRNDPEQPVRKGAKAAAVKLTLADALGPSPCRWSTPAGTRPHPERPEGIVAAPPARSQPARPKPCAAARWRTSFSTEPTPAGPWPSAAIRSAPTTPTWPPVFRTSLPSPRPAGARYTKRDKPGAKGS